MTQSGIPRCRFKIAVDRDYAKPGEQRQSDFFYITAWRQTAEFVNRYFVKGKPILIEAKIQNDYYIDKNGVQQYRDQIIADSVSFLLSDPTRNANGGYNNNYSNNGGYNNGGYNNSYNNGYQGQNSQYNNGGYNNPPYDGGNGYQNNGYGNQPPYQQNAPYNGTPAPAQPAPEAPKEIQLGDSGLKDFEQIVGDGDVPF